MQHAADEMRSRPRYAIAGHADRYTVKLPPFTIPKADFPPHLSAGFVRRNWLKNMGEKKESLVRSLDLHTKFEAGWPELDRLTGPTTLQYSMRDFRRLGKAGKKRFSFERDHEC